MALSSQLTPPLEHEAVALWEDAPCAYLSTLPDGTILRANRTFLKWTGYSGEQVCGRRFQTLLSMAGQIYHETHLAPLLRMQGEVREIAFDLICANGERLPVLLNAVQRRDEGGAPIANLLTLFNASDRRRYEQELLQARRTAEAAADQLEQLNRELEARVAAEVAERLKAEESLRQAQKLEAIGQLTGGVAHDFNNLLTVIIGSLDSLTRHLDAMEENSDTRRIRRFAGMALQGGERAATLTARLLAFSRRQPLDPRAIDANQLIAGLSDLLHRTLEESISLQFVAAAGLWSAHADPTELERVIVNLAVNARDAMPNGGKLTIETGNVSFDEAYVEQLVEPVPPGQYVLVAVTDTGTGMDAETLGRVFEPFFTTKEAGKGTGLGLSHAYGFVRQSGGHVRIYSELGEGTTIKLYLPRAGEGIVPVTVHGSTRGETVDGGTESILVVEDHPDLRAFTTGALRELGYVVLEAANGPAALDLVRSGARADLLFTDVVLPDGMNGRQVADQIKELLPSVKVLFTTGYTRNAIVHNGRLDPGVSLLPKPFTYNQLGKRVRELLDT
jgi:PAS domain S-box-containing protein